MAVEPKLSDQEIASLLEIPHPSKEAGESIYGATKVFPDYQAEPPARRTSGWSTGSSTSPR